MSVGADGTRFVRVLPDGIWSMFIHVICRAFLCASALWMLSGMAVAAPTFSGHFMESAGQTLEEWLEGQAKLNDEVDAAAAAIVAPETFDEIVRLVRVVSELGGVELVFFVDAVELPFRSELRAILRVCGHAEIGTLLRHGGHARMSFLGFDGRPLKSFALLGVRCSPVR